MATEELPMVRERRAGYARRFVCRYMALLAIAAFLAVGHLACPEVSLFDFIIPGGAALALAVYTTAQMVATYRKKKR